MIPIVILLLIFGSVIIAWLNHRQIKPGYLWFLAVVAAITAWVILISAYPATPRLLPWFNWESEMLLTTSPTLLLDEYSWSFGVAISTIFLAVLLTDVARVHAINPNTWAGNMAITGAGLLAIFSGNPLTLLFGWAVIDIVETTALLRLVPDSSDRERVVVAFSIKVLGMLLVVAAIIRSRGLVESVSFTEIPSEVAGYLILAAGLRLGIFPPHQLFIKELSLRRGYGTILRLVPVAASLILITRVALVGAPVLWQPYLLGVTAVAGLYGALAWTMANHELDGRPFWILGMAALSVASAVSGVPIASKVWGLSLLFSGGILFLYSARNRWLSVFPLLGWLGFLALPFSPAWHGLGLFTGWNFVIGSIFVSIHALLLIGYVRHVFRANQSQEQLERLGWVLYPLGLAFLSLTFFGMSVFSGETSPPEAPLLSTIWWGGTFALLLAALLWSVARRFPAFHEGFASVISKVFSLGWLYRFLWVLYRSMSSLVAQAALILEGEGGILWAVLILILLMTAIIQRSGGG